MYILMEQLLLNKNSILNQANQKKEKFYANDQAHNLSKYIIFHQYQ